MKTNEQFSKRLYKVSVMDGQTEKVYELYWLPENEAKLYAKMGYSVVEVASCKELAESQAYLQDAKREKITKEDIQDIVIDLYIFGRK